MVAELNLEISIDDVCFVAFDFETTGLNPRSDRIIEIGAVKFKDRTMLETFEELVNPDMNIPEASVKISGIHNAMVQDKPFIDDLLDDFLSFIEGTVLIAHNASFDLGFLRAALNGSGHADFDNLVIDTHRLARKAYSGQQSYSLQSLVAMLGLPPNNAHRALDDAMQCMKLFQACSNQLSFMGDISLKEVLT